METILIERITVSRTNPRKNFNEKAMEELTENIRKFGVLQPILVRPMVEDPSVDGFIYELVAGERRLRAAKAAGLTEIPAIAREMTDQEAIEIQVIENLHRADLHPMEEAEGYERLMQEGGYTAQDLAVKVGKSLAYIYGRMKLCDLSEKAREAFYKDEISASMALLIARLPDDETQDKALEEILPGENEWEHGMGYKEAVEYIHRKFMLLLKGAPFNPKDPELYPEAGSCVDCHMRTGNQKELFPDVESGDTCTDPKCFEMKKHNAVSKKIAAAAKKGIKVLQGKKASAALSYNSKYIDLDFRCWDDEKGRTYGELLGKHNLEKVLIVTSDNELSERYDKVMVNAELAKKYDFMKEAIEEENEPEQTPEQIAAEERKHNLAVIENELTLQALVEQAGKKDTWDNLEFWKYITLTITNGYEVDHEQMAKMQGRQDYESADWQDTEKIIKAATTINELKIIITAALLSTTNDYSDLVKLFAIDKKAIKTAAKEKMKEQEEKEAEEKTEKKTGGKK